MSYLEIGLGMRFVQTFITLYACFLSPCLQQSFSPGQAELHFPFPTFSVHSSHLSSPQPWPSDAVPSPLISAVSLAQLVLSLRVDARLLVFGAVLRERRLRKGLFLAFADIWEENHGRND